VGTLVLLKGVGALRFWLLVVCLLSLVLGGCSGKETAVTYANPNYRFTVTVPNGWQVNKVQWAPPPPEGTYITSLDGDLVVSIDVSREPPTLEEASLRQDGWQGESVTVDGVEGRLYSRPVQATGAGTWRRAYVEQGGNWYRISLSVPDRVQALTGEKAFAAVIDSLRWAQPHG
jgi:hypothetical protein